MFDIFYTDQKPNLFAFEQPAANLVDAATKSKTEFFWLVSGNNDYTGFDFEFQPPPWEVAHVHVFPSQHQRNGDVYFASKANAHEKQWHFRTEQQVTRLANTVNWAIPDNIDLSSFDFSWHPDSTEPDFSYYFGTQWQPAGGPIWLGTSGVCLVDMQRATALPTITNWTIPDNIDATQLDLSWHPNPLDPPYIYHFPSEWQASSGLEYSVAGATEISIQSEMPSAASNIAKLCDVFFLDMHNITAKERLDKLKLRYPHIQSVRHANSLLDTIKRCATRSATSKFWIISSENVYDDFDFSWHAQSWQSNMTHVFPTQWDKWSHTFLITKWEFERHITWAQTLAEFPNLNFVTDQYVKTGNDNFDMYYVDHGNTDNSLLSLKSRYPQVKVTRFVDNQLDALRRIMNTTKSEYVWVTSSLCDYTGFDFTWTPEPWQAEMIHCFGSEFQKRGDTFYIHVESFKTQMTELELLDWFNVICYHNDNLLLRYDPEHVHYGSDNLVAEIMKHEFKGPYTMFMNRPGGLGFEPCMWTQKDRMVVSATTDNGCVAIPRDIKQYLKTQVYDYPYIDKSFNKSLSSGQLLSVIFISNGEPDADKYWNKLQSFVPYAKRSDGVKGRTAAYQAAARLSDSHWFLAVFAKLDIEPDFDWTWQPDMFQEPKHYIFNSKNPLNGLEYGHQGMIAYNRKLVLENNNPGLDFTLSQPHESVPILSGTAYFNQDSWMTWRTAFREVIKLKQFESEQPTIEGAARLHTWLTVANGDYAEWCLRGASDGVEYFNSTNGDHSKLMLSFEWQWLNDYFKSKNY